LGEAKTEKQKTDTCITGERVTKQKYSMKM